MQFYNTMIKRKEEFSPREPGKVYMYVCGITAYDLCHIGHARSAVIFDVLVRFLRFMGYDVKYVRNFTDIDDKIINRANKEGLSCKEVAEKYIAHFHEDMDKLGILRPDIEPKATEHIKEMQQLIQKLIEKKYAYVTKSGDVYFRVKSFPEYGVLSGSDIENLEAGKRVKPGEEKEDPLDFALWKSSKPGEPWWESPWGKGRPGWHIECSAMSEKYLGLPLDIHGGGQDLIFPHHENERAQTKAATGKEFVRYWIHNGFVQINSEKMSKSLGNFITLKEIFNKYQPETLRFFLLTKHYRTPLDFSWEIMEETEKSIKRIYLTKSLLEQALLKKKWKKKNIPEETEKEFFKVTENWSKALEDDLNTALLLGNVFTVIRIVNRLLEDKNTKNSEKAKLIFEKTLDFLKDVGSVLGLFLNDSELFLKEMKEMKLKRKDIDKTKVEDLIQKRNEARKNKKFEIADSIRDELLKMGIEVHDTPQGTFWDVI